MSAPVATGLRSSRLFGRAACWRAGCAWLLPILLYWAFPATRGAAQQGRANQGFAPITTAYAAHEITLRQAKQERPVRLRATVTYYDPYIDPRRPSFFVCDATGCIFVALAVTPKVALKPGQLVEVTGTTGAGDFAPIVEHATARVVGQSHLPYAAPRTGVDDLLLGNSDGQWVEVEGVVHAVRESGQNVFLDLALTDGPLTVFTLKDPAVDFSQLVDSKVLVRGNAAPLFNHQGQMTGTHLLFPGMASLRVEDGAEPDPFDLPLQALGNLLRYQPKNGLRHRIRVRGTLTLLWPGRMICLQNGAAGLCAQTSQTDPLELGDTVDVVGFPTMGGFTPTLAASIYRQIAAGKPAAPTRVTAAEALSGKYDSQLVSIDGQFIEISREISRDGEDPAIVLSADGQIFTVSLASSTGPQKRPLERGTLLRVTGICSVQVDTSGSVDGTGFARGKSFRILQRSQDGDTTILRRPSWWNTENALGVLVVAILIAMAALAGILILRDRVEEQTAVIRAQLAESIALKEAAEYQATHDGLTGLNNRKAIFALLSREFEPKLHVGISTGIIMMDLDHFKRVNDTYGHAAGDEVLRETARRLVKSVRLNDFVGRYGGEEFLIVLPDCDLQHCHACAERIRRAIAEEPMDAGGGLLLAMTASLGLVVAVPRIYSQQQALVAADRALYQAKRGGRNRVAAMDPNAPVEDAVSVGS